MFFFFPQLFFNFLNYKISNVQRFWKQSYDCRFRHGCNPHDLPNYSRSHFSIFYRGASQPFEDSTNFLVLPAKCHYASWWLRQCFPTISHFFVFIIYVLWLLLELGLLNRFEILEMVFKECRCLTNFTSRTWLDWQDWNSNSNRSRAWLTSVSDNTPHHNLRNIKLCIVLLVQSVFFLNFIDITITFKFGPIVFWSS